LSQLGERNEREVFRERLRVLKIKSSVLLEKAFLIIAWLLSNYSSAITFVYRHKFFHSLGISLGEPYLYDLGYTKTEQTQGA
jgi:hypothetical protein